MSKKQAGHGHLRPPCIVTATNTYFYLPKLSCLVSSVICLYLCWSYGKAGQFVECCRHDAVSCPVSSHGWIIVVLRVECHPATLLFSFNQVLLSLELQGMSAFSYELC